MKTLYFFNFDIFGDYGDFWKITSQNFQSRRQITPPGGGGGIQSKRLKGQWGPPARHKKVRVRKNHPKYTHPKL